MSFKIEMFVVVWSYSEQYTIVRSTVLLVDHSVKGLDYSPAI